MYSFALQSLCSAVSHSMSPFLKRRQAAAALRRLFTLALPYYDGMTVTATLCGITLFVVAWHGAFVFVTTESTAFMA